VAHPPGEVVADFEEYARIYRDAWSDPAIRWLLSTVPSAMIFDDHEVAYDWDISEAWVEEMRQHPAWNDQIVGGYASYWIYQHLGNLSPEELEGDGLYDEVKDAEDAWPVLREFAYRTHRVPDGARWSYHRGFGKTRLLMIDSRGGRVLPEHRRSMVDAEEWAWVLGKATGGFDHLLIGTSPPPSRPRNTPPPKLGRKIVLGHPGLARRTLGRELPPLPGSRSLGLVPRFLCRNGGVDRASSDRQEGQPALDRPDPLRRRTPRLLRGSDARKRPREPRLPGALLPLRNALPSKKSFLQDNAWSGLAALTSRFLARLAGIPEEPLT
jgi:hypothetical protein